MNLVFTPTAWEQYTDWQKEDKKMVKRINELIKDIEICIYVIYKTFLYNKKKVCKNLEKSVMSLWKNCGKSVEKL